ncbi:C1q-related factor-like [Ptychodera flava]|uniref:C1q-related factor-like n=1 Tax=Ptychodera flava TaxID=63121 RepID=UPI00396A5192
MAGLKDLLARRETMAMPVRKANPASLQGEIGPKGPKGMTGSTGGKGEPGNDFTPRKVAFSVVLSTTFGPFENYRTVPFDHSFTNIGGNFNLASGEFTCPVSGHYYINVNVHKRRDSLGPFVILKKNGQTLIHVDECCEEDAYDTASNTIITHLNVGDKLRLDLVSGRAFSATNGRQPTFNGFLLYKD